MPTNDLSYRRLPVVAALLILVGACVATERRPGYSGPPAGIPQATLHYTASTLEEGALGFAKNVSSVSFTRLGGPCGPPLEQLGDIRQVAVDRPVTTVQIPAGQPLALESFWNADAWQNKNDMYCIVNGYAFTPRAGATYRLTNVQHLQEDRCSLRLEQRMATGEFSERPLRNLTTACGRR